MWLPYSTHNQCSPIHISDDWAHNGGVLLMGYEMYRLLTSKRVHSYSRSRKSKKPEVIDIEEEERNRELLTGKHTSIVLLFPILKFLL